MTPLRVCHVFSSFNPGGPELRAVTLMNAFGRRVSHTIMATDGQYAAADGISPDVDVRIVPPPPGKGSVFYGARLLPALRALAPDLLLTYNWGAIDAVLASSLGRIAPTIHAEDGFGPEEATSLKRRRVLARRVLLPRVYATIVPSRTLLNVVTREYRLPGDKVQFIANGVDAERFTPGRGRAWRQGAGFGETELLFGTCGALRAEKNLTLLVAAFAAAQLPAAKLLVAGDGPCRTELEAFAAACGIADRVVFVGHLADPAAYLASLDVFVMSSMTEQMPIALLEAMASGLPAICTDVGDTSALLGTGQFPAVVPPGRVERYTDALVTMARDRHLRCAAGRANRARAVECYSLDRMVQAYERLYFAAAQGHV